MVKVTPSTIAAAAARTNATPTQILLCLFRSRLSTSSSICLRSASGSTGRPSTTAAAAAPSMCTSLRNPSSGMYPTARCGGYRLEFEAALALVSASSCLLRSPEEPRPHAPDLAPSSFKFELLIGATTSTSPAKRVSPRTPRRPVPKAMAAVPGVRSATGTVSSCPPAPTTGPWTFVFLVSDLPCVDVDGAAAKIPTPTSLVKRSRSAADSLRGS
mmetsp:Transcript_35717/g.106593  ORF Transcript_35717/g.106593 Transcript_35717/m.106593 type:complete len:215 (+) Transcript_35717:1687-2331(+)